MMTSLCRRSSVDHRFGGDILPQRGELHVSRDADDVHPGPAGVGGPVFDPLSDGIDSRPVAASERFAHEHRARRRAIVASREIAAAEKRNPHRAEISRADFLVVDGIGLRVGDRRVTVDREGPLDSPPFERLDHGDGRRLDAGEGRNPASEIGTEAIPAVSREGPIGHVKAHRDEMIGPKPRIGVEKPPQAAQKEPRADQEHGRERDFGGDQHSPDPPLAAPVGRCRRSLEDLRRGNARATQDRDRGQKGGGGRRERRGEEKNRPVDAER